MLHLTVLEMYFLETSMCGCMIVVGESAKHILHFVFSYEFERELVEVDNIERR